MFCFLATAAQAQSRFQLAGLVKDQTDGSPMALANVYALGAKKGIVTNDDGYFSMQLPKGLDTLRFSFIGYNTIDVPVYVRKDSLIHVNLTPINTTLREVELSDTRNYAQEKLDRTEMSTIQLSAKDFNRLPSITGEADVIKAIQLLPGVNKGVEGGSDLFVRGGDADQNLVLLDGATVYNTGHLFGFLSVFNPDIIRDAKIIKGAFPADYGGRLSSILDIRTKNEIPDSTEINGMVGLISSSIHIAQPLKKDELSFRVSARRTYIDQLLSWMNADVQIPYYFYDMNGRVDWKMNENHEFFVTGYLGQDVLDFSRTRRNDDEEEDPQATEEEEEDERFQSNFDTQNNSITMGWNYKKDRWESELLLSRTFFSYIMDNSFVDDGIKVFSDIEDYGAQWRVKHKQSEAVHWSAGASILTHDISPSVLETKGAVAELISSSRSSGLFSVEGAVFGHWEQKLNEAWLINVGLRQSFATGDGAFYTGIEPRLAARYKFDTDKSFKGSYSLMRQHMHRVSTSTVSLPIDLWYSITEKIKPQSSHQFTLAYVQNFPASRMSLEVESYFKYMQNITEYEEGTNLVLSTDFEDALLQGEGRAYGLEVFARKEHNRWNAWFSYALAWADRQFDELNGGERFAAKYDRRHTVSLAGQYDFNERWTFSLVWEFISGSKFTPIIGQYAVVNPLNSGVDVNNIYSKRNEVSLSDSHRLDLAFILKSKERKRFQSEWHFGVYNVYNRATPVSISIRRDRNGNFRYSQPGLFGLIPSVSYKFKW